MPLADDCRCSVKLRPGWGLILPATSITLTIMLKLMESLAAKAAGETHNGRISTFAGG
jgi:hypothetical protein